MARGKRDYLDSLLGWAWGEPWVILTTFQEGSGEQDYLDIFQAGTGRTCPHYKRAGVQQASVDIAADQFAKEGICMRHVTFQLAKTALHPSIQQPLSQTGKTPLQQLWSQTLESNPAGSQPVKPPMYLRICLTPTSSSAALALHPSIHPSIQPSHHLSFYPYQTSKVP